VSRAWIMIGLSVRFALGLGLHLRNENPTAEKSSKESLGHTWWTIYSIECLMNSITGRPPVIAFEDCTVPLSQSFPGEGLYSTDYARSTIRRWTEYDSSRAASSNNSFEPNGQIPSKMLHFTGHIRVSLLSRKVLLELYGSRTASKSWRVCF
jgi:hypothetical protein